MATRSDRNVARTITSDARGVYVNFITSAICGKDGGLQIAVRGRRDPLLLDSLGSTPAGVQLTSALLASLHVNGGTWTSSATIAKIHYLSQRFMARLAQGSGIQDLADPQLAVEQVWELIIGISSHGGTQRNLRTFLAEAFPTIRGDGTMFRDYLLARTLVVDVANVEGYAPEVADAIEEFAKKHVSNWYLRHRSVVARALGHLPEDWLAIPAPRLVESGLATPRDWRVTQAELAAAMVLLSLADNKGPNLSVMQSYTADSVERANADAAFVTGVKARNGEVLRTPAPAGGLFSYGGLLEFVAAATRVDRYHREYNDDFDRLLFVATGAGAPMNTVDVNRWWTATARLRIGSGVKFPATISFRRLRKAALLRGKHKGYAVIGQTRATARLYLADAVPDVILIPGLLDTQTDVSSYWRSKMAVQPERSASLLDELDEEAAISLSAAEAIMDVGVAACISNGQSPTDAAKPCGLGPIACFLCPNGYRTPETIPGLIAAVEFTDNIRKYEPTEWLTGDAPILNELAKKTLNQFPKHLIDNASSEATHNARALIACVYVETRTRD